MYFHSLKSEINLLVYVSMNLLTYFFTIFLQKEDPRGKEKEEVNTYFFFIFTTDFIHKNDKCSKNWTLVIFSLLLFFWLWTYAVSFKTNEQEIWKWYSTMFNNIFLIISFNLELFLLVCVKNTGLRQLLRYYPAKVATKSCRY